MKISISNISFSYNGTPTLSDIDFGIEKGDLVALVGPNGSGKSTLIKCMNGILKPYQGTIFINEKTLSDFTPVELAKEMAYIPQNENRNASMNVFDMVLLGRKPYINWKPSEHDLAITGEIIEALHIGHLAMRPFNKLSGGQQQTVYIARALAQEPDILLLDEPTSNLDMQHQLEVLELLKSFTRKGLTVIIALHDINLAARYSNKMMMLKSGRVFAAGTTEIINETNIENLFGIKVKIIKDDGDLFVIPKGLK
ncbi:MAG: ABC transporter ATP-binding protein [Prolixibacteraceae bacterium]|nr:ABC transporter ATP-binding protein [Prolixibacteraceae bacterium]